VPGANSNAVAELAIAGMLLASRNIPAALNFVSGLEGDAESINNQIEKNKKHFAGFEVSGKTLGVLGLGAIGVKVANSAAALGLNTIGFDPFISPKYWSASALLMAYCLSASFDFMTAEPHR
jgi:D-3-phosphoglycerate dehydrogenase